MNTASEPYRTALLITMSISYSRYFSTAMPMATHRHTYARLERTAAATQVVRNDGMNVTTTSKAAAANHFSCSRSSPDDRANRTTTAATLTTSAAGMRMISTASSSGGIPIVLVAPNGSSQRRLAFTSMPTVASANVPPTNHAARRHRRELSCPVGKSRDKKASAAMGITQIQLASHMAARPAGQDPGAATKACSPQAREKEPSPNPRPATTNTQPTRFAGRRDASTKPTTGMARFATPSKTSEKFQPVRSAG